MPCNCGKKNSATAWVLTTSTGTQTYPTEVQANAAKIRAGGGTVTPKR